MHYSNDLDDVWKYLIHNCERETCQHDAADILGRRRPTLRPFGDSVRHDANCTAALNSRRASGWKRTALVVTSLLEETIQFCEYLFSRNSLDLTAA